MPLPLKKNLLDFFWLVHHLRLSQRIDDQAEGWLKPFFVATHYQQQPTNIVEYVLIVVSGHHFSLLGISCLIIHYLLPSTHTMPLTAELTLLAIHQLFLVKTECEL